MPSELLSSPVDVLIVEMLITSFAAYRLARFVAIDYGPFDVFLRLRVWAGAYDYGADGRAVTALGRWIGCIHCVGPWAVVAVFLLAQFEEPHKWITLLAIAGMVEVMHGRA